MFKQLFSLDIRNPACKYAQIFSNMAQDCYNKLNDRTQYTGISNHILELFIQNYEDGHMSDDDFTELLHLFGKSPADFGFELNVDTADLEELQELFEGGNTNED